MRALKLTLLTLLLFSTALFAQYGRGGDNRWGSGAFGVSEQQSEATNVAPVITSPTVLVYSIAELEALHIDVVATDADGDAITLSIVDLPTGATFVDNGGGDGDFDWTPGLAQAAVYTPSFVASDGVLTDTVTVTITVTETDYSTYLIATAADPAHLHDVSFNAGSYTYSLRATAARATLVDDGWTITDGGSEMGVGLTYYWRGDYGITLDAPNVDSWEDMLTGLVANSSGDGLTLTALGGQVAVLGNNLRYLQTAAFGAIAQPFTCWVVTKTSTNGGVSKVTIALAPGISTRHGDSWADVDDYFMDATNGLNDGVPVAGKEEYRLIIFEESANVDKLYVDGAQAISGDAGAGTISTVVMFARDNGISPSDNAIAEVGIMSGAATTAQKAILHDYMESRYGFTVADLP